MSCEPSRLNPETVERHGCTANSSRNDSDRLPPAEARDGQRVAEELEVVVAPQPAPHRPGERQVVHDAVPAVAVELAAGVVGVLGDEVGVRLGLGHRRPHRPRREPVDVDVAEPPGHVGDVDPPAVEVERRAQPARRHRVGPLEQAAAQLVVAQVELRQARDVEPRLVVVGVVAEVEEAGLRRAGIGLGGPEPVVAGADVVDRQIADDADAPVVARLDESGERIVAAEVRVDVVERVGVVAVARRRREERRQVEPADAERREVVEMGLDTGQVAAVHLVHGAAPVGVDRVVPRRHRRPTPATRAARRTMAKRSGNTW